MTETQKKANLLRHVKNLCDILNQNNIKDIDKSAKGELIESLWKVDDESPEATFGGGISSNREAFTFLKQNGHIDVGVCWDCGEEPIGTEYTFTFRNMQNYICKDCYVKGQNISTGYERLVLGVMARNFLIILGILYLLATLFSLSFSPSDWNLLSKIIFWGVGGFLLYGNIVSYIKGKKGKLL